jgi:Zn-dependent protease with chaperone function
MEHPKGFHLQVPDSRLCSKGPMIAVKPEGLIDRFASFILRAKARYYITPETHPDLHASFSRMAAKAHVPTPELLLVESKVPNAAAVSDHRVVITTALMKMLTFDEAEAILGHELGHVSHLNKHLLTRFIPGVALGTVGAMSVEGLIKTAEKSLNKSGSKLPFWTKTLPFIGYFAGMVAGNNIGVRATELEADAIGAGLSGKAEALSRALIKLHPKKKNFQHDAARIIVGYPSLEERMHNISLTQANAPRNEVNHAEPLGLVARAGTRHMAP